jgi:hypothetical protein
MKVDFTPLTASLIPACRDFNERLRLRGALPFPLPEQVFPTSDGISQDSAMHFIAVDEHGVVRGGVLLSEMHGWLKGEPVRVINIQSPLSEGIVERAYAGVGLQMLKFINERGPYSYAVGMGGRQNPFPRFLKAAGWLVIPVPFSFSVMKSSRFLREMVPLQTSPNKWIAQIAATTGLGGLALGIWNIAHSEPPLPYYSLDLADTWPRGTQSVWEECRDSLSFSVMRDEAELAKLYPNAQPRLKRFLLSYRGKIVGWSVGIVTQMHNHSIFGNLLVGTILDGLASDQHLLALLALSCRALKSMGADLILTNQTCGNWQSKLRQIGFFRAASNYLVSLSKPLAESLRSYPEAFDLMHVNRGDGDGRMHV